MTVALGPVPRYQWQGLSGDTKPTGPTVNVNDIFFETDTGAFFIFGGAAWAPYNASSGGAASSITYNPALLPTSYRLTATQIQSAIDEILSNRISAATLLSQRYSLVGDDSTDNNAAILAWIAAGTALLATGRQVIMKLVPDVNGANIFQTTGRHVFPPGMILVFEGESILKATGTDQTAPLITHTNTALDLGVDDGVTHIRTNRNHIGIRTLNANGKYMRVRYIRGFTLGHQLAATTFTSPITVDYGLIGVCPYPVECCTLSESSAFVSDCALRGGEIIPTSSLNNWGSFAALTIATEYDAGNAGNSGNYWHKPQVQSGAAGLTWSAGASLVAGRRYYGAITGSEWFCKTSGTSGAAEPTIIPAGSNRVDVSSITTIAASAQITMASTTGISAGWHMRGTNPLSNFPFDTYVLSVDSGTQLTLTNVAMSASTNYRAHFIAPTTDNTAVLIYVGPYRRSLVWNRDCGSDNGIYNTRRETGLGEAVLNSGAYLWPPNSTGTQTFETTVTINSNSVTAAKICLFPLWTAATAYVAGDMVRKTIVDATFWECIVAGTSHATTEPTIADIPGTTGTDNTVTWIARAMPDTASRGDIGVYTGTYFNPRNYISSVIDSNVSRPSIAIDNLQLRGIGSATGWLVQGMQKCTTGGVLSQTFAAGDLALARGGLLLLSTTSQLGFLIRTDKHKSFQITKQFGSHTRQRGHATAFDAAFVKLPGVVAQNTYNPRINIGAMTIGAAQWTDPADTSAGLTNMLVGTDTSYVFYGVVLGTTGTPIACTLSGISVTALPYSAAPIISTPQVSVLSLASPANGPRASLGTPTSGFFLALGEYIANASGGATAGYTVTTIGILAPSWVTLTTYVKGQLATASGNVYAANGSFTSGTTPSGTGLNILDGTATAIVSGDVATWDFIAPVAVLTSVSPVSQATVPTWTGIHTWALAEPRLLLNETDQAADVKLWDFDLQGGVLTGRTRTDADGAGVNWLSVTRGATTAISNISLGNATNNPTYSFLGSGVVSALGGYTASGGRFLSNTTTPQFRLSASGAGSDLKTWQLGVSGTTLSLTTLTDANAAGKEFLSVVRGTTTAIASIAYGNATDNPTYNFLGTGTLQFGGTTTGAQTATFVAANKPGAGAAGPIAWLPVLTATGTAGYIPVFGG